MTMMWESGIFLYSQSTLVGLLNCAELGSVLKFLRNRFSPAGMLRFRPETYPLRNVGPAMAVFCGLLLALEIYVRFSAYCRESLLVRLAFVVAGLGA